MPHLIKKIVNAFDRSGKKKSTDLKFRGQKMSLDKLYEIWECDGGRMGDIRTNILTKDHFEKNSYSCMRVFLAVQVMSQSMLRLILRHAEKCDGIDNYKGVIEIIKKVDR